MFVDMKIELSEDEYQALSSHLVTRTKDLPPTPVYLVLLSLVPNPADIKASLMHYDPGFGPERTVWRVHLLTTSALAVAEIEFEEQQYTRQAESQFLRGGNPPGF